MPAGLPKRLMIVGLLAAAYVGYFALVLNNLLDDAIPSLATLAAMWALGVATYPRERPRGWDWLAPAMVVVMGLGSLMAALVVCWTAGRYAGRTDFNGLPMLGLGLVGAALVRRVQMLMDESRTWRDLGKPAGVAEAV